MLTFSPIADIIIGLNNASVAQSVVHLTRNEKVACSSQVTSSKKRDNPRGLSLFLISCLTRMIKSIDRMIRCR